VQPVVEVLYSCGYGAGFQVFPNVKMWEEISVDAAKRCPVLLRPVNFLESLRPRNETKMRESALFTGEPARFTKM
jgi:hypothetical protein